MNPPWPAIALGAVLRRSERIINIHPDQTYREIKVRINGKGVVERRVVKGAEIAADRRFQAQAGQFIISRIDARHGASGIVPPELHGAIVTNDFPVFDIDDGSLDAEYLAWLTKTASFIELCKRASEGTTNRVRLSEDRFAALTIPIPPVKEQRRIVARIDELAARASQAIALRDLASAEIKALQRSASRRLFEGLGQPSLPLEEVCEAIIDNLHSNPVYSDGGMVPCIRSPDVGFGTLDLDSARRTDEDEYIRRTVRGEPQADDIVLVREGGGTGKCGLVGLGQRFSLGQRVMMLRPDKSRIAPKFFLYQLLSPVIQDDYILPLSKGSASPHLNIGALRRFPIILPTFSEQEKIVAGLDALQSKLNGIKSLQAETGAELDAMLPAILDKAFKGNL